MNMRINMSDNFSGVEQGNSNLDNTSQDSVAPSRLAGYLRLLGALAVIGSGVVYMLQGLHSVDVNLRYWIYIALMLVLGAGGIFSFKLVEDRKGARLFFGLAVAMVPVQFSQLGGMVFNYFGGGHGKLFDIFQFSAGSLPFLLTVGMTSLAVAGTVGFAAFSVLCRPHAKKLTGIFTLLNLAMLLPVREFPLGLLPVAALAGTVFLLEKNLFARNALFRTMEGISVRAIFLLPVTIIFVRAGFHADTLLGVGMLDGLFALALAHFAKHWFTPGKMREYTIFIAYLFGIFAGVAISEAVEFRLSGLFRLADSTGIFTYLAPIVLWSAYIGRMARSKGFYRGAALVGLLAMNLFAVLDMNAGNLLFTCLVGAGLVVLGVRDRARLTVGAGVAMATGSFLTLLLISITHVNVNIWLALAVTGVIFVGLSSVLEKHGRRWITSGREHLAEFLHWEN